VQIFGGDLCRTSYNNGIGAGLLGFLVKTVIFYSCYFYSRPHIALAIAECYVLIVLFLFSVHRFFNVPEPVFAKLTQCGYVQKLCPMGVFVCAPEKFEGQETPIFASFRTQSWHFEPHHLIMWQKSGNLKQQGQSVARLWCPYQTCWVSHHRWLRSDVALGHEVGQMKVWFNITSAVWQLVTRCLILGGWVFRVKLSIKDTAVVSWCIHCQVGHRPTF